MPRARAITVSFVVRCDGSKSLCWPKYGGACSLQIVYDRVAGWLPNHDRAHNPKFVGGIMARVEITFAVYRPPIDDLPYLVVVLADGNVLLTEPVKSFEEGEELVDYLSRELLKAAPPRD